MLKVNIIKRTLKDTASSSTKLYHPISDQVIQSLRDMYLLKIGTRKNNVIIMKIITDGITYE